MVSAAMATTTLQVMQVRRGMIALLVHRLGVATGDAAITVDHWIRSEQAGKACHGLVRALYVIGSGAFGGYDGVPAPAPVRVRAGRLHVDGTQHLGYPVMARLVARGCDEARSHGSCVFTGVGVYPSGMLGDWARLACERGCGLVLMAGSPPRVAAPDGRVPLLGTNPLCVGLPTAPHFFVCDSSTSALTHGDLLLAQQAGVPLPPDSAVDGNGARTTDASAVAPEAGRGALLPVGGSHKSFAVAMAIEMLSSLGGGVPGSPNMAEHGVFGLFLGPDLVEGAGPALAAGLAGFAAFGARIPGWESSQRAETMAARGEVEVASDTWRRLAPMIAEAT